MARGIPRGEMLQEDSPGLLGKDFGEESGALEKDFVRNWATMFGKVCDWNWGRGARN